MSDLVKPPIILSMTGDQHHSLEKILFPGDGNEAVALLLCGRREGDRRHRLVAREVHPLSPASYTIRTPTLVTWQTDEIAPLLDRATAERLSVIKVHSHPGGHPKFSASDDQSDEKLIPMIRGWVEADIPHGSAVMLPGGQMFGRVWGPGQGFTPIECINIVGDDLYFWYANAGRNESFA